MISTTAAFSASRGTSCGKNPACGVSCSSVMPSNSTGGRPSRQSRRFSTVRPGLNISSLSTCDRDEVQDDGSVLERALADGGVGNFGVGSLEDLADLFV